jgi:hypothetical protein
MPLPTVSRRWILEKTRPSRLWLRDYKFLRPEPLARTFTLEHHAGQESEDQLPLFRSAKYDPNEGSRGLSV